jgi:hypothetical protein
MKQLKIALDEFQGYLALGMDADANDLLEGLPEKYKTRPEVLVCRLELLMVKKRWEEAVILGQSLCGLWPEESDFWLRTAFCLHELKRTIEARQTLLDAPEAKRRPRARSYTCVDHRRYSWRNDRRVEKHCLQGAR